jgi:hypothetical protein
LEQQLTATLLTRRSIAHQSEMTNYSSSVGQQFQLALQTQIGALSTHFGPVHAQYPAELLLYRQLLYQATDWAFVDCSVGWPCSAIRERGLSGSSSAYRRDASRPEPEVTNPRRNRSIIATLSQTKRPVKDPGASADREAPMSVHKTDLDR